MVRIDHLSPEQYQHLPARERDLLIEQPETPCPLGISSDEEEEAEDEEPDDLEEESEQDNDKWPTQESVRFLVEDNQTTSERHRRVALLCLAKAQDTISKTKFSSNCIGSKDSNCHLWHEELRIFKLFQCNEQKVPKPSRRPENLSRSFCSLSRR